MDSNPARLCRLCLETSDDSVNIFEEHQGATIALISTKHFWFQIHKNDGMSKWICEICWIQTKTFHHFYKRIEFRYAHQRKSDELITPAVIEQERSASPSEDEWEPDLNIVKCEETELTEVAEVIDYNVDESEDSETSDDEEQHSNKKSKKDEVNRTADNQTIYTDQSSRRVNDEDAQMRQFFTMKCELCDNVEFQTLSDAQIHYRSVHNTKGYLICCGKQFKYRCNILGHVQYHTDPIAFRCDQCGKSFHDKRALKSHIENHLPLRTRAHKCSSCPSSFTKAAALKLHVQNVHSGEKFPCDKCDKIFRTSLLLSHHFRDTHYKHLFEHVCEICSRGFRKKHLLLNHTAREHSTIVVPKAQCNICGEWLEHERGLQIHLRVNHQDANFEAHTCVICNKVEESNESLASHIRSAHFTVTKP